LSDWKHNDGARVQVRSFQKVPEDKRIEAEDKQVEAEDPNFAGLNASAEGTGIG
jgi:hypothetical protein